MRKTVPRSLLIIWSAARPRAALIHFGLRHVSCRFCIFPIASSPPIAFDFITLSCHFGSAVRLNAVKQVPLSLPERKFGWYDHCHHISPWHPITESRNDPATRVAGIQSETCVSHFWSAARPRAALIYFGVRHVPVSL